MNSRPTLLAVLTLALGFGTIAAGAAGREVRIGEARSIERTFEASTAGLTLPSVVPGPLFVQGCSACPRNELRVTGRTVFRVGDDAVTLAEFAAFLRTGGPYYTTIHYGLDSPEISLVQVAGRYVRGPRR